MDNEPRSSFYKLRCTRCKNIQITFSKASRVVKCLVCDKVLAEPTGGKIKVRGRVLEVL